MIERLKKSTKLNINATREATLQSNNLYLNILKYFPSYKYIFIKSIFIGLKIYKKLSKISGIEIKTNDISRFCRCARTQCWTRLVSCNLNCCMGTLFHCIRVWLRTKNIYKLRYACISLRSRWSCCC